MVYMLSIDCCLVDLIDSGLYVDFLHVSIMAVSWEPEVRMYVTESNVTLSIYVYYLISIVCMEPLALGEWVELTGGKRIL